MKGRSNEMQTTFGDLVIKCILLPPDRQQVKAPAFLLPSHPARGMNQGAGAYVNLDSDPEDPTSGGPSALEEVKDHRNDGEDQQQVNEETCGVKDHKATEPRDQKHYTQNEKHLNPLSSIRSKVEQNRNAVTKG